MFVLVAFKGCVTLEVKDTISFTNCNRAGIHGDYLTVGCLDTTECNCVVSGFWEVSMLLTPTGRIRKSIMGVLCQVSSHLGTSHQKS